MRTRLLVATFLVAGLLTFTALGQEEGELMPAAPTPELRIDPDAPLGELRGIVMTRGKRKAILGATVTIVELARTDYTGEDGRFRFDEVPAGVYHLSVSAAGHDPREDTVRVLEGKTPEVQIFLDVSPLQLEEVVVRERRETPNVSDQTLEKEEIQSVPGASNDPVKAVANLPGVAKTNPIGPVAGLVIRGTSQEDSGYYMDGIFQPFLFHFGGLDYTFNSELVQDVNYLPGGYGVRYGGAIGGVVEVTSRRPRTDRIGGVANLSTYSSYAIVEGPIVEKVSFAVGARRSFIDYILPALIPKEQLTFTVAPSFWDYQALLDYRPSVEHTVSFTGFGATDQVGLVNEKINEQDPLVMGNQALFFTYHRQTLAWKWEPSASARNTLTLFHITSRTDADLGKDWYLRGANSFPGLREEFEKQLASWNRLTVGCELSYDYVEVDLNIIRPPKEGDPAPPSFSNEDSFRFQTTAWFFYGSAYIQDEIDLGKYVRVTPGVRFDLLTYTNIYSFDPRLFLRFKTSEKSAIKVGLGQYHQFPQADEIVEGLGNPDLEPENSYQANLGFEYAFPYAVSLDVQGFYKYLDHLVSPADASRASDKPYLNTGIGEIYGGELLVRKKLTDWWLGWLSYSYTVSRRKDGPGREWRFFDQDQTHNFVVLSSFQLPRGFKLGFRWQYATGTPYTDVAASIYNADTDSYLPIFSDQINEKRNPDLHQLDVRFDKIWTFNTWELDLFLDVQNAYLRPQPFGYLYNYDFTRREQLSFPLVIPAFGLSARF